MTQEKTGSWIDAREALLRRHVMKADGHELPSAKAELALIEYIRELEEELEEHQREISDSDVTELLAAIEAVGFSRVETSLRIAALKAAQAEVKELRSALNVNDHPSALQRIEKLRRHQHVCNGIAGCTMEHEHSIRLANEYQNLRDGGTAMVDNQEVCLMDVKQVTDAAATIEELRGHTRALLEAETRLEEIMAALGGVQLSEVVQTIRTRLGELGELRDEVRRQLAANETMRDMRDANLAELQNLRRFKGVWEQTLAVKAEDVKPQVGQERWGDVLEKKLDLVLETMDRWPGFAYWERFNMPLNGLERRIMDRLGELFNKMPIDSNLSEGAKLLMDLYSAMGVVDQQAALRQVEDWRQLMAGRVVGIPDPFDAYAILKPMRLMAVEEVRRSIDAQGERADLWRLVGATTQAEAFEKIKNIQRGQDCGDLNCPNQVSLPPDEMKPPEPNDAKPDSAFPQFRRTYHTLIPYGTKCEIAADCGGAAVGNIEAGSRPWCCERHRSGIVGDGSLRLI